ncbi:MAG TPA: RNA polymerase sigma factor [Polyangiaceae bacterium]|nr:RNA polymerase sigma factor [Polyangiaceae bacterium]
MTSLALSTAEANAESASPVSAWYARETCVRETPVLVAPVLAAPSERELLIWVMGRMRHLAGPHVDSDDLVQKAWIEACAAVPRFRGECSWRTYVSAICFRVWSKHVRWSSRWLRRFTLARSEEAVDGVDDAPGASERLETQERRLRLYSALDRMSPKRRSVVVFHDLEGLELEEIARIVDAPVATVRTRLRDGRKVLGQLLRDDPYFAEGAR